MSMMTKYQIEVRAAGISCFKTEWTSDKAEHEKALKVLKNSLPPSYDIRSYSRTPHWKPGTPNSR